MIKDDPKSPERQKDIDELRKKEARHAQGTGGTEDMTPSGMASPSARQGATTVPGTPTYPYQSSRPSDYVDTVRASSAPTGTQGPAGPTTAYGMGQTDPARSGGQMASEQGAGRGGRTAGQEGAGGGEYRGTGETGSSPGVMTRGHEGPYMERPMGERGPMSQTTGEIWHGVDTTGQAGSERREEAGAHGAAGGTRSTGERAGEYAEEARRQGSRYMGQARERTMSMLDERKMQAADQLHSVADAFRGMSSSLRDQRQDTAARYADWAAGSIESAAGFLREQDPDILLNRVRDYARRQPELFLGTTFALGFLAMRWLKSSGSMRSMGQRGSERRGYEREFSTGASHMPGHWGGTPEERRSEGEAAGGIRPDSPWATKHELPTTEVGGTRPQGKGT